VGGLNHESLLKTLARPLVRPSLSWFEIELFGKNCRTRMRMETKIPGRRNAALRAARTPATFGALRNTRFDWGFRTGPQDHLSKRQINYPRGADHDE